MTKITTTLESTTCNLCGEPILMLCYWKESQGRGLGVCQRCQDFVIKNGDGHLLELKFFPTEVKQNEISTK